MASLIFLKLNGWTLTARGTDFERAVLAVAQGRLGKNGVAEFFRMHSRR